MSQLSAFTFFSYLFAVVSGIVFGNHFDKETCKNVYALSIAIFALYLMFEYLKPKTIYFSPEQIQKWRNSNRIFKLAGIDCEESIEDFYAFKDWLDSLIHKNDQKSSDENLSNNLNKFKKEADKDWSQSLMYG